MPSDVQRSHPTAATANTDQVTMRVRLWVGGRYVTVLVLRLSASQAAFVRAACLAVLL